jgi:hypothetical protein
VTLPDDAEWVVAARQAAVDNARADPVYAELMGTYAALGELLYGDTRRDDDYVADCRTLVARLVALGKQMDVDFEQAYAAFRARLAVGELGRAA